MKIYTKTGDRGETRLFDGTRVAKTDVRVEAYGNVDELNSTLGLAVSLSDDDEIRGVLYDIQKQLLSLGAQLADPGFDGRKWDKPRLSAAWVRSMEELIDRFEAELPPLKEFILSGGGQPGATLHLGRTVCRRAERGVVLLNAAHELDPILIEYLNRLSDLLFVMARVANHREGMEEIRW